MINILLLGGSGFIGRNVIDYYKNNNNINLEFPSSKELNLLDEKQIENRLKLKHYDVILNFALYIDLIDKTKDASKVLEYNLKMYYNFAKYSYMYGKMIYLGSGAEYDKRYPIVDVKEENCGSSIPIDQYGLMKYIIGLDIDKSSNTFNLRIFGIFGKYENYKQRFISNIICKYLLNKPITINQNVYFDYLYVNDFLNILDRFIYKDDFRFHTYNVCSGDKHSLINLITIINDSCGINIEFKVLNEGLNNEYTGNNDRLLNELKDLNFTNISLAVKELYDYYKNNIDKIIL